MVTIVIDFEHTQPVSGSVTGPSGTTPFQGWLTLIGLLERDAQMAPPAVDDAQEAPDEP